MIGPLNINEFLIHNILVGCIVNITLGAKEEVLEVFSRPLTTNGRFNPLNL
jgi:hypothetical protein